ncbi:MAG: S-layer protein domain-containing protein [Methanothrix sp.]|nr:S-layer protein domain-containing protein [Methanothrix sp.]
MKIRTIWFVAGLALLLVLFLDACAQEPVETAFVRGHFSDGDGIWRADDFGWFYYDLDKGQGGEQLRIDVEGRTAEKGHVVYSTQAWSRQFEYEPWGSFRTVAFLGKPYLAGYPESSITDEVSVLGKGELRKVLLDGKDTHILTNNSALPLLDGYVLAAAGISEKNDVVNFVLLKNGKPVDTAVVSIGGTYVYKIDDVPVLLVHLANAMRGGDFGFAEVDGIFQVSDEPDVKLFEGGRLGNMELTDLSEKGLEFQNDKALTFTRNAVIPLTGDMVIVVIDNPKLFYYPEGALFDFGVHEIRGPAFNATSFLPVLLGEYRSSAIARWNAENYSGFYFDPENGLGAETLVLYKVQGRTVQPPSKPRVDEANKTAIQEGFQYTSFVQPKQFEFKPWGDYFVMSFLGTQWFAGYDSSLEGRRATQSLLEDDYLGMVLMDREMRGIVLAGNYTLAEGYEMRIRDVENDSIFIQLLKDGDQVDSSVVKSNSTYVFKKNLGDVEDMPIIMVHVSNVFNNGTQRFATIDGIFQISDQYVLPVEPGLGMGEMEIVSVQPNVIVMVNHDSVNLNRDSTVALGPGMSIRVADNDTLRYYPYINQYVVPRPQPPLIHTPSNATSSAGANFSMVVRAAEIRLVTADILDSSNRTVSSRDITGLGQGSGELWSFSWRWNATTLQLGDDKSPVLDAGNGPVPGQLYLSPSLSPVQVGVKFDPAGRIASIVKGKNYYYVSRSEYGNLNAAMDYDTMLANETARRQFIRIELGKSVLRFFDIIDGRLVLGSSNHTLEGTLEALEPHALGVAARPDRYELRVRVENAVDAIQVFGEFFNVTPPEVRGVSLGSAEVAAKDTVSIPLEVPLSGGEKRIVISYDASVVKAQGVSGACNSSWQNDAKAGRISVVLPAGCGAANLTFLASKANATADLKVINVSGFSPETVANGTITVLPGEGATRKSGTAGFLAALTALALGAFARRRI